MKGNDLDSWQTILTVIISSMGGLLTWILNSRKQKDDRSAQLFDDIRADRDGERKRNEDLQRENDSLREKLHEQELKLQQLEVENFRLQAQIPSSTLQVNQNQKKDEES